MWPMKLDMTKEECRGVLRRLELESYGSLISTFRAQGYLCKEKLRILEDLRRILHISNDRHRAEARRVANDERLYTVAEIICGPNSSQDWRREGHRTFPILPRSVPHTALTYIANTVYEQLTRANCKLAHPASTSCDRLRKADEEMFRFELVRKELSLFEKGFERDAAVVTTDPLQDVMAKSYIHIEDKRTEESKPQPAEEATTGAGEQTQQDTSEPGTGVADEPEQTPETTARDEQPSLSDILLDNSPMVPSNSHSRNATEKLPHKSPKSAERTRKKSQSTAKRHSKVKSPYPVGKPSKNGPVSTAKQTAKTTSIPSPHLMHSYAVPFDVVSATNGGNYYHEPPQLLQQHLTSNMPYPGPVHGHHTNAHGSTSGQKAAHPGQMFSPGHKASSSSSPSSAVYPSSNYAPPSGHSAHSYKHQQGILPSSKKDIQYNLSKLNPTNSGQVPLGKGTIAAGSPLRSGSGSGTSQMVVGQQLGSKGLPAALLNYQKKTNSKNILIPTSAAAATLASLGLPPAEHTSDWIGVSRSRSESGGVKFSRPAVQPHHQEVTPMARIVLSTHSATSSALTDAVDRGSAVASSERQVHQHSTSVSTVPPVAGDAVVMPVQSSELTSTSSDRASTGPTAAPVVNSVPREPVKQPHIAGFTPVKGGSKLSVSKTQLMPLVAQSPTPPSTAPAPATAATTGSAKNNVFILPKPPASASLPGVLNVGQKINIAKCIIDPALTRSPPKVIVQPVPSLNSVPVSFDLDGANRKDSTTTTMTSTTTTTTTTTTTKTQQRPLFALTAEKLPTADVVQGLTPLEIAAGGGKVVENIPQQQQRRVSAFESVPGSTAPVHAEAVVPMRKITISASQLIPFKGTLRDGMALSMAAISSTTTTAPVLAVTKQLKLAPVATAAAPIVANKTVTDWEQEVDRANGTQEVAPSSAPESVSSEQRSTTELVEEQMEVTQAPPEASSQQERTVPVRTTVNCDSTKATPSRPTVEANRPDFEHLTVADRGDDSSVTDSADAEEDPDEESARIGEDDGIEEDDYDEETEDRTVDVEADTDGIIVEEDEANYDSLIEEVPDDENFIEEIVDEQMEISYESSRELEHHPAEDIIEEEQDDEEHPTMNGIEHDQHPQPQSQPQQLPRQSPLVLESSGMHFVARGATDLMAVEQNVENGDDSMLRTAPTAVLSGSHSTKDDIVCELLEIDADGTYSTRQFSYEQAIAEGLTVLPTKAKPAAKINRPVS